MILISLGFRNEVRAPKNKSKRFQLNVRGSKRNDNGIALMKVEDIAGDILSLNDAVVLDNNWGERALFYNPGKVLKKGIYIATFKERDGANDSASKLSRGGLYRLNVGLSKSSYFKLFGPTPARPAAGHIVNTGHDFTAPDLITPHPIYGWMSWIAVINPSRQTYASLRPYLIESLTLAKSKFAKRVAGT
jgi:Family of unknown function (DUF6194)